LITGASSGIGAATAKRLALEGYKTALIARRVGRLVSLEEEINAEGGQTNVFPADLAIESERQNLYKRIHERYGGIDVLVNNAGFGWYGYYTDMPWDVASQMVDVNITAVAHLTSLFLPQMKERNSGHIINIGSIVGSFPNQGVALYSASKSFLDAFTTVLYRELRGTRVHSSVVRAGPVRTEFFEQVSAKSNGLRIPAERFGVTAELVAERIVNLLKRPRRVIYVPGILALTPWLELLFGRLVDSLGPLLLRRGQTGH